jgi:hypothetical protein
VGVTSDVIEALAAAPQRIQGSEGEPPEAIVSRARRAAIDATDASNSSPSDLERLRELSVANADVAAAYSLGVDAFPSEVAVGSLLPIANLSVSLGREFHLRGELDAALDRFMAALALVEAFRAYTRTADLDRTVYAISARTAAVAGEAAARKRLSLEEAMDALNRNIVNRYERIMKEPDLAGPRAFGVVAFLREALLSRDSGYIRKVRDDVVVIRRSIRPSGLAGARFDSDLEALLKTAAIQLGEEKPEQFRW